MSVKEAVLTALKELILPELQLLKQGQGEIKTTLALTNKRLDDVNAHLVDQSRRLDAVREELGTRIDGLREQLTAGIEAVREELTARIEAVREELAARIDAVREELTARIDTQSNRIDAVREELTARIEAVREEWTTRFDTLTSRIEAVREELGGRLDALTARLDDTNKRLDRLYEVIVRREEHYSLAVRVTTLEQELADLKKRLAA